MSERDDLLASIAGTLQDYRADARVSPTQERVDLWIRQFARSVQVAMLRELDHVFKRTYFSQAAVRRYLANRIRHPRLAGEHPCTFWQAAHLLKSQKGGNSQKELLSLLGEALSEQFGLKLEDCGAAGGPFVYLDDALFSGDRIVADLSAWTARQAPQEGTVHIIIIAAHELGRWHCRKQLKKAAARAGKNLKFPCWAAIDFENRLEYCDRSEVLWPCEIPEDRDLQAYVKEERDFPFQPRQPGGRLKKDIFSSEEGRQLLERELLLAGMRIRSLCENPARHLRPLGYSSFGVGFGSMVVTYRNCPNNVPLALWWGDPEAGSGHPLGRWYPLLPRIPNSKEARS